MYCHKKQKRNLNNIFEIITCVNCNKYKDDEIIKIGNNVIKIYPIFKGCINVKYDILSECFSERLIRMLIEIWLHQENNDDFVLLWSNDGESEFIYNLGLFEAFIDQGLDFLIIY